MRANVENVLWLVCVSSSSLVIIRLWPQAPSVEAKYKYWRQYADTLWSECYKGKEDKARMQSIIDSKNTRIKGLEDSMHKAKEDGCVQNGFTVQVRANMG